MIVFRLQVINRPVQLPLEEPVFGELREAIPEVGENASSSPELQGHSKLAIFGGEPAI
jgi:hypothetical protein